MNLSPLNQSIKVSVNDESEEVIIFLFPKHDYYLFNVEYVPDDVIELFIGYTFKGFIIFYYYEEGKFDIPGNIFIKSLGKYFQSVLGLIIDFE